MHTPIPKERFMKMLAMCLKEANYFVYDGHFYRQNLGMFMGSSLAPILVERVIEEFVERALKDLQIAPDFWSTYVDDHLTSIPEELISPLHEQLNSYDQHVRFTVQEESPETNSIAFLDLTVYNKGTQLRTNWFHKAIASNRILNFHSRHPVNMIMNVAKSFILRVLRISHSSFHSGNFEVIKSILAKNNFPSVTIRRLLHQVINSPKRNNKQPMNSYPFLESIDEDRTEHKGPAANSTMIGGQAITHPQVSLVPKAILPKFALGFAGLTYVPGISESLTQQLRRHAPDLKLAPRPSNKVAQVFSDMKYKLTTGQNSCVVYEIRCKNCENKFYYGETSRCLCERCEQHTKDVNNLPKKPRKSALVAHVHETKHEFDLENPRIVKKVRARGLLKIHEANQVILHEKSAVNFKKDAKHVSPVFYNIIQRSAKFKPSSKHRGHSPRWYHTMIASRQNVRTQNESSVTFDVSI